MTDQLERYGYLPVLAVNARAAARNGTRCAGCGLAIWRGQRIATLTDGRGNVHTSCAARSERRTAAGAR